MEESRGARAARSALRRLQELASPTEGVSRAEAAARDAGRLRLVEERLSECSRLGVPDAEAAPLVRAFLDAAERVPLGTWSRLGRCLVPETVLSVEAGKVAVRWAMRHHGALKRAKRVAFVLGWLAAVLESDLVDPHSLDIYYHFFVYLLECERFVPVAAKFVQHLSKPHDVTEDTVSRVVKLIEYSRGSRMRNALYGVLASFKLLKPELTAEIPPSLDLDNAFPKIHKDMIESLRLAQNRGNLERSIAAEKSLAWWKSPHTVNSLIPDVEYIFLGSGLNFRGSKKTCLDFQSEKDLLSCDLKGSVEMPSQIMSLLVNDSGLLLLLFSDDESKSRFSNVLYQVLYNNFIHDSGVPVEERKIFLERLVTLENYALQGIPVVSRFLALYISTWNGHDFSDEIFQLLEWITFDAFEELYDCILSHLENLYFTNSPRYCCKIVQTLKRLYVNIFEKMIGKTFNLFLTREKKYDDVEVLNCLSEFINDLCEKSTYELIDDVALRNAYLDHYTTVARLQTDCSQILWTVTPMSLTYTVLCSLSAYSIDRILGIFLSYHRIYEKIKSTEGRDIIREQIMTLQIYTNDYMNCLWYGDSFADCKQSLLFRVMSDGMLKYVKNEVEDCGKLLHVCYHIAYAPYTYMEVSARVLSEMMKREKLLSALPFKNLSKFIDSVLVYNN